MKDVKLTNGTEINRAVVYNYLRALVNLFFKILPMRETGEESVYPYMRSLQRELSGYKNLVVAMDNDGRILSLLSILQYLIDHPDCELKDVRAEVFRAISICNKLKASYGAREAQ